MPPIKISDKILNGNLMSKEMFNELVNVSMKNNEKKTINAVYEVLVLGRERKEVALKNNISVQRLGDVINKSLIKWDKFNELKKMSVISMLIPIEAVEKVEEIVKQYMKIRHEKYIKNK